MDDTNDTRPFYWVARGVPLMVDGKRIINEPIDGQVYHDADVAEVSCMEARKVFPDATVIEGRRRSVPDIRTP